MKLKTMPCYLKIQLMWVTQCVEPKHTLQRLVSVFNSWKLKTELQNIPFRTNQKVEVVRKNVDFPIEHGERTKWKIKNTIHLPAVFPERSKSQPGETCPQHAHCPKKITTQLTQRKSSLRARSSTGESRCRTAASLQTTNCCLRCSVCELYTRACVCVCVYPLPRSIAVVVTWSRPTKPLTY